jgi:hypothetical protein
MGMALLALAMTGCGGSTLHEPATLTAPYAQSQVWAVVPFDNQSGVPQVRTDQVADQFAEQIQQIEGLDALPVNRVIAAMRTMDVDAIRTPGEARTLIRLLGVDGLLVGAVTAYDAYPPPKLGLAVQLYRTDAIDDATGLDPHALSRAPTDVGMTTYEASSYPTSSAAGVFDARHHDTRRDLEAYAVGRTDPDNPFGTDIHLARMDLYTQFVSYRLLRDLLDHDRTRISSADGTP